MSETASWEICQYLEMLYDGYPQQVRSLIVNFLKNIKLKNKAD